MTPTVRPLEDEDREWVRGFVRERWGDEMAIGFYRAHGFDVVAVREGAVEESRKLKPSIRLVNEHGVPIADEIEMERRLPSDTDG